MHRPGTTTFEWLKIMAKKEKKQTKTKNKKEKKPVQPQHYVSATNIQTYNYKVYYMKPLEKVLYFLLAFIVGAAVGYLFYGGIGKDEFGDPTLVTRVSDAIISCTAGLVAGFAFIPIRTKQIIEKQIRTLKSQFRDMLEALTTNLGAGKNITDSFQSVYEDLKIQYDDGAYILKELEVINSGMLNNVALEEILYDFGQRSGAEDIVSFANVFQICYRKGGNIKDTIRNTHSILCDKMEINEDIETVITANKTEQNIMLVMPVVLIGLIKFMSPEFAANFTTPAGLGATTAAVAMFMASYYIGKVVLDIKV